MSRFADNPRHQELLAHAVASTEGRKASEEGKGHDANPYPEDDECHWRWLDSWCVEESAKALRQFPDKAGIPFIR